MTEEEQGTSRWSVCKEPCAFSPVFCRLPTYRTASRWPIPLQTPREAVEPNKYNLFLVGTLTWHRKGVIADSGKIIDYHVDIHDMGPTCQRAGRRKERKTKWSVEGCESIGSRVMTTGAIHSDCTTLKNSCKHGRLYCE